MALGEFHYKAIFWVCTVYMAIIILITKTVKKGWKQGQKLLKKESNVGMHAAHW